MEIDVAFRLSKNYVHFEVCELQWTDDTEVTVMVLFLSSVISALNGRYSCLDFLKFE